MTLQELIRRFRVLAKDYIKPLRAETEDVVAWLNDAQAQACVRGRLLVADSDPALCQIALTPGQHTYSLHPALYEIIDLRIGAPAGQTRKVVLKSREWLERSVPNWRNYPRYCSMAIQNDTSLRLVGQVEAGEILSIEAYRLPLQPMSLPDPDDPSAPVNETPEIHAAHHEHLIEWALHKAFSVPDSELFDPSRAKLAEEAFTRYFGPLPDSDMRRATRHDVVQHNVAILP